MRIKQNILKFTKHYYKQDIDANLTMHIILLYANSNNEL